MLHLTKQPGRVSVDTLDVQGLSKARVDYLKELIELWKKQDRRPQEEVDRQVLGRDSDKEIVFATHQSRIIGGKVTRAMAYED